MDNEKNDMMLQASDEKQHRKKQEPGIHTGGDGNSSKKKVT